MSYRDECWRYCDFCGDCMDCYADVGCVGPDGWDSDLRHERRPQPDDPVREPESTLNGGQGDKP